MDNMPKENENFRIARELSQKYEFYLLALVFTVLAFSVQTAEMLDRYYQYCFEIIAWVLFLISGLVGLSRIEWLPVAYKHYGSSEIEENNLKHVNQGNVVDENGEDWIAQDLVKAKRELENNILERKQKLEVLEKATIVKFGWHKWCFLLGLLSLIISRAIFHLIKIGVI